MIFDYTFFEGLSAFIFACGMIGVGGLMFFAAGMASRALTSSEKRQQLFGAGLCGLGGAWALDVIVALF